MKRKMFTTGQVAKMFNVSSHTVVGWFDNGYFKDSYRIPVGTILGDKRKGNIRRMALESILLFCEEHKIPVPIELVEKFRIVYVGYETDLYNHIEKEFSSDFVELKRFSNIFEATITISETAQTHVLVCDMIIGRFIMLEFNEEMRRRIQCRNSTVIVIANEDETGTKEITERGATFIFRKPFNPNDVLKQINPFKPFGG